MVNLTAKDIRQKALDMGFTKVGIVEAVMLSEEALRLQEWLDNNFHGQMAYMSRHANLRIDPRNLMPSARSVVCVALNYYSPEKSRYAWGDDYHDVLRDKLKELLLWIQSQWPETEGRICIDSAPAMDKAWAVRAGIGWLGKHTNIITRDYGSWVFLGELLLSIPLEYDSYIEPDHCGKCTACMDACPTQAIIEPYKLDATKCISYGTIELKSEHLPEPIQSNTEGWVFGCDICQDVCPWNRFSKESKEKRFEPRTEITSLTLDKIVEMAPEDFPRIFRKNPVKRTKLTGLKRNAQAVRELNRRKSGHNSE
jgi:epoxyqueuosine reductase